VKGIGIREVVALGVLGLAILFGYLFLDPAASESPKASGTPTISLGLAPPTVTPTPTATPLPPTPMEAPRSWFVTFYESSASGNEFKVGEGFRPALDFGYDAGFAPDVRDDQWRLTARAQVDLPAGRYSFVLEYDCALSVQVAGQDIKRDEPSRLESLTVEFEHDGGRTEINVSARDQAGRFDVRWRE